jgi:FKBP-type peptidyl-prolyl cis-trans isomerase 2
MTQIMTEKVKEHDFVEVDYTGKLPNGAIFDTTQESVAKENHFHGENMNFNPAIVCVGEKQLLPGLDAALVGKEVGKEFSVTLQPEDAFGKRNIKNIKIIPMSTFKEHKMQPQPGLQIDVDGKLGTVSRVAGGRVIVNFNHELAGKEVIYDAKINRMITDKAEQVKAFVHATFRMPLDAINVTVTDEKALVEIPMALPVPITEILVKKVEELVGLKSVEFKTVQAKK